VQRLLDELCIEFGFCRLSKVTRRRGTSHVSRTAASTSVCSPLPNSPAARPNQFLGLPDGDRQPDRSDAPHFQREAVGAGRCAGR
jgi:hypothetical protein